MSESRMKHAVGSTAHAIGMEISDGGGEQGTRSTVDQTTLEAILAGWPDTPKKVARTTIEKYGPPNEATESRLVWHHNSPWKRTIVYRDEVPHDFPKPHTDLLEQFIDYRVPIERLSDLGAYDGSVIAERTKGEISARCDMEEMNFLALNLAHDVSIGKRSVDDARRFYAETATAFMMGDSHPYTQGLQFEVPDGGTADRDQPLMRRMVGAMAEQLGR